jgi:Type IV secretion-system coupling protein DNA-binding domain
MRVVCIHIPRKSDSVADAVYATKWSLVNANFFQHVLDGYWANFSTPVSLELFASRKNSYMCLAGEHQVTEYIANNIYTFMAAAEMEEIHDYLQDVDSRSVFVGSEFFFKKVDVFPLQSYKPFAYDSMAPVVSVLSQLPETDRVLVQLVLRPHSEGLWLAAKLRALRLVDRFYYRYLRSSTYFKRDLDRKSRELVIEKCKQKMMIASFRVLAWTTPSGGAAASSAAQARLSQHVTGVANAFKIYNTVDENSLKITDAAPDRSLLLDAQKRRFRRRMLLSTIEVTTLWHPPSLGTMPNTAQVMSKKVPPPRLLPQNQNDPNISFFGVTNHRKLFVPFGLRRFDRQRHLYAIGKPGTGKSYLMQLLIKNDIENGFGCAVLDPHGDLIDDLLKIVPRHRIKDVVIFDPSDPQYSACFNPMSPVRPELKMRVMLSFLDTFKRAFQSDWSDQMDHVLRYALMGLLSVSGSSIQSLRRMLSDDEFRREIVRNTQDESVKRFWFREFPARRQEFEEGAISRLLNRLDELLVTDTIRNILGQPQNLFDFREFMDKRRIVLLKISKGVLGTQNANLLGSLAIWKIYEAAMSRADLPAEARQDFYFYIDEFQNFANDSFSEILSESRKYGLCLTLANQFVGQLHPSVRQTLFGNVANLLCFRIGADDAAQVAPHFESRLDGEDLLNLALRDFYVKMSIDGEVQEPFSGRTLDLQHPVKEESFAEECITHSRTHYSRPVKSSSGQPISPNSDKDAA